MSQLSDQKSSLFGKPKGVKGSSSSSTSVSTTAKPATTSPTPVLVPKAVGKTASLTASTAGKSTPIAKTGIVLSPAARSKKIDEAKEESAIGMKNLKTSVFQWNPDHLAAAPHFEASSNAYKAAGELKLARLMMLQSADSHEGAGCPSAAAVTCIKSAVIAQSMGELDLSSADYQRAAELYGINGDLDKCAEIMARAAKELVDDQPAKALELYMKGIVSPPDYYRTTVKCFLPLFCLVLSILIFSCDIHGDAPLEQFFNITLLVPHFFPLTLSFNSFH